MENLATRLGIAQSADWYNIPEKKLRQFLRAKKYLLLFGSLFELLNVSIPLLYRFDILLNNSGILSQYTVGEGTFYFPSKGCRYKSRFDTQIFGSNRSSLECALPRGLVPSL
jgi:hypothetical protein